MQNNHSFLSQNCIAVFGLSRNRKTFAEYVREKLQSAGFKVYPMHPTGDDGYYKDLESLPERPEAIYIATNPTSAAEIVDEAIAYGVKRVWLQFGSYNKEIIEKCRSAGLEVHAGCLMMYIPGAGMLHSIHRVIHELIKGRP